MRGSATAGRSGPTLVPGTVTLVGGGPGPLDLMTVRAHRALAQADVIVTDRLGPGPEAIAELGWCAEVIDVGKHPGHHPIPQEQITALLIEHARAGRAVVRLKGGDPFVFGRGGEEVAACRAAGIEVAVIPGVSSAIAVPQAAGIPVTHRGTAATVHIVHGQGPPSAATLAALADGSVTTIVLMGVAGLERLVAAALAHGTPASRPAAIVESGHTDRQRTTRAPLGGIVAAAREREVRSPAVIMIGEVARAGLLLPALPSEPVGAVQVDVLS